MLKKNQCLEKGVIINMGIITKGMGADKVEGPLKVRKDMRTGAQKPGASAIEIYARINRKYR